ncbi:hypothetical protein FH972_014032 [Carpinus fangiana]|uniref:Cytoplasmic tRNA adenylyltransferase 1 n=1 Tax=Carpinus fangiana TaxID=176857 RepID=A0A5N6R9J4_9ROSI|nr:hypothetical protein FH972_014032 [Carpinus fangiana]
MKEAEAKPVKAGGRLCCVCNKRRAALKRPKTLEQICRECFYEVFEEEIHHVIVENQLFKPGERIAIGSSGGKDSTVLACVLSELNRRHNYGLDLFLLSVDEGITGYRDDSLETVKRNEIQYGLPLKIVSYKDLYGWTMDEIVKTIGLKNNCTFCGVFRRQALDRGAALLKVDKLATGHNADDIAETVLLNILRGDIARLSRCTIIITGEDEPIPRCKPFKHLLSKCISGFAREFIKDLERIRPRAILDIIQSGENFRISTSTKMPEQGTCERCGYISSQKWCKACVLLEGLNRGLPKLGIGRSRGLNNDPPVRHLNFCELQGPSLNAHRNDEVKEVIASSLLLEGYIHPIIIGLNSMEKLASAISTAEVGSPVFSFNANQFVFSGSMVEDDV